MQLIPEALARAHMHERLQEAESRTQGSSARRRAAYAAARRARVAPCPPCTGHGRDAVRRRADRRHPRGPSDRAGPVVRCIPLSRGRRGYRRMVDQKTHEQAELADGDTACAGCGAVAEGSPPTWTCSVENGERRYFCDELRAGEHPGHRGTPGFELVVSGRHRGRRLGPSALRWPSGRPAVPPGGPLRPGSPRRPPAEASVTSARVLGRPLLLGYEAGQPRLAVRRAAGPSRPAGTAPRSCSASPGGSADTTGGRLSCLPNWWAGERGSPIRAACARIQPRVKVNSSTCGRLDDRQQIVQHRVRVQLDGLLDEALLRAAAGRPPPPRRPASSAATVPIGGGSPSGSRSTVPKSSTPSRQLLGRPVGSPASSRKLPGCGSACSRPGAGRAGEQEARQQLPGPVPLLLGAVRDHLGQRHARPSTRSPAPGRTGAPRPAPRRPGRRRTPRRAPAGPRASRA